ncbi:hypothetical protein COLO4_04272 [Corchorus olitorius]|uniref:CCHC-type domain-containing protein n=1 Tax=Corchorus olitorius TaxID=93759 RepID=A0A1R3KUP7_9ROSI|nr:hypothetical protein COLO4_04272 [Corchorus olitorius]
MAPLIGIQKFFTVKEKSLNRRGVIEILKGIWSSREVTAIKEAGNNLFAISFVTESEMNQALEQGPSSIMGHSMNLQRWDPEKTIHELEFEWMEVRVAIDVMKPLCNGFWVPGANRDRIWAKIRYEKLANCFNCGKLGHINKFCKLEPVARDGNRKFGPGGNIPLSNINDLRDNGVNSGSGGTKNGENSRGSGGISQVDIRCDDNSLSGLKGKGLAIYEVETDFRKNMEVHFQMDGRGINIGRKHIIVGNDSTMYGKGSSIEGDLGKENSFNLGEAVSEDVTGVGEEEAEQKGYANLVLVPYVKAIPELDYEQSYVGQHEEPSLSKRKWEDWDPEVRDRKKRGVVFGEIDDEFLNRNNGEEVSQEMGQFWLEERNMARKGPRASWAWASILEGRDVIKDHLKWLVMNGESIRIWEDSWVPDMRLIQPQGSADQIAQLPQRVSEILDRENGVWNLESIRNFIPTDVYQAIQRIPIGQTTENDEIIWPVNKDGNYTVKSGYHVMKDNEVASMKKSPSSSHTVSRDVWKNIWKIQAPTKVQNFLWRACHNALATYQNLWKRKIIQTMVCF